MIFFSTPSPSFSNVNANDEGGSSRQSKEEFFTATILTKFLAMKGCDKNLFLRVKKCPTASVALKSEEKRLAIDHVVETSVIR